MTTLLLLGVALMLFICVVAMVTARRIGNLLDDGFTFRKEQ